ncbi:DUF523 domain-containing protein [Iocasia frigidifontis]|uniref:DUF523 domain-containing protein n=1 Tax=Iocasia fonsfrigidae TaxID=2682810 RepID=A0A8A7KME1_9FIRM|nr:DUF523 domain-containing protein [Iocasia fonsfrigidae]QTL99002.1 DUF523 domain-containing protein [Iocasia fonsfrigidae]
MILVSACLMGKNCRYDGGNQKDLKLIKLLKDKDISLLCPEVEAGLNTPRPPAEIIKGDGCDVLQKKAQVLNKKGEDVTDSFIRGCQKALAGIDFTEVEFAVLKSRSPSCGVNKIYSGKFDGKLKKGSGVTAAFLKGKGIAVYTEEEIDKIIGLMK